MIDTPTSQPHPYELRAEPDGSAWTARENLADILSRELLGPMHGDHEVLAVAPDTVYPIGRIAPRRLADASGAPALSEEDAESSAPGDAELSRGVPVSGVDDTTADGDEDAAEDTGPKRGLMIPASMGLRFQLAPEVESFTVIASWGTYHSHTPEGERPEGVRQPREFVRTPHDSPVRIRVADLRSGVTVTHPLLDDCVLRVDSFVEPDRRLVEIALCNDAEVVGRIPVSAWLFQAKLWVEADGAAAFLPVRDALVDSHVDPDPEVNRLSLQYRDRLEFALGRTCSVDWHVESGARRATKLWTTWLPVTETPQTRAFASAEVITDMRALATASVDELRAGLEPIATGYTSWLELQKAKAADLPSHLRSEAMGAIAEASQVATRA